MSDLHVYVHVDSGTGMAVANPAAPALPSPLESRIFALEGALAKLARAVELDAHELHGLGEQQGIIYRMLERLDGKPDELRQRRRRRRAPATVEVVSEAV